MFATDGRPLDLESLNEFYKKLEPLFNITSLSIFVREIYAWMFSGYCELRKEGVTLLTFEDYSKEETDYYFSWVDLAQQSLFSPTLHVRNYDTLKGNLSKEFLTTHKITGIDLTLPSERENTSPSLSQFNVYEGLRRDNLHVDTWGLVTLWLQFRKIEPTFRLYVPEIAEALYVRFQGLLLKANSLLPVHEKLSLEPSFPEGYTEEWDKSYINPEDLHIFLEAIQSNGLNKIAS